MNRIEVKAICVNENGKQYENMVQVENLLQASRFINTFRPKRGYKVLAWNMEEIELLV